MKPNVVHSPVEVAARLAELGLAEQLLHESLLEGQAARAHCSRFDPPNLPGGMAWGRSLGALRERLDALGWTSVGYHAVNKAGDVAVNVATGDEGTGLPSMQPRTRNARGRLTQAFIDANEAQLNLFEVNPPTPAEKEALRGTLTWMLLFNQDGDEIRCELSLPASIGVDGRVEKWRERLILQTIVLSAMPIPGSGDAGPDIVVEVERLPDDAEEAQRSVPTFKADPRP